jgi:UDP-hydrolysing UDP-N-acetyl-D-glucosamine 2-epimerase
MMNKICVFTGTRAEYGLMYWLMKDLQQHSNFELQLLVSGAHLSPEFDFTYKRIEQDGFEINEKVEMLLSSDTAVGVAKSVGLGVVSYADSLSRLSPDCLVILGDRYEALAIAQTAMLLSIPICHIAGGEVTEGAYDDAIRHAITKFSYWHFTSNERYRQRVIQLGEDPQRVFNVGAIGLDHLKKTPRLSLDELSSSLGLKLEDNQYFLVTYHSVTIDSNENAVETCQMLLAALDHFLDKKIIITYPNADDGGRAIIALIERYAQQHPQKVVAVPNLGQQRYISAVQYSSAVIGNSSSGISEVPSFHVPTVNIGSRQKGRLMAHSIYGCTPEKEAIITAIKEALSPRGYVRGECVENPYGSGNVSEKIIHLLEKFDSVETKSFHDVESVTL